MSAPSREPTVTEAADLTRAAEAAFGPCDCHTHPRVGLHPCAGHEFLLSDPTGRQKVHVWQRLLWLRSLRSTLLAQEGVVTPDAVGGTVLPW